MKISIIVFILFNLFFSGFSQSEFIFGDPMPEAPILSDRGDYKVGVRT